MAIALAASYNVNSTALDTSVLTTASFTPAIGEVIIVKCIAEDSGFSFATPTGGGLTYTSRVSNAAASNTWVGIWTAVTTAATSMTVSSGALSTAGWHSMTVERWTGARLAASPVTMSTRGSASKPSSTLTTTANNSIISWADGDWSAQTPGTPGYLSSATQDGIHDKSTANYVAYYAYQTAAVAGSQSVGMTTPSTNQTWNMLGVEVLSGISVSAPFSGATTATTAQSSFTIACGAVVVGDTVVVCVGSGNAAVSTITDSLGNTYALGKLQNNFANNQIYYAKVTVAGTPTITVNTSAASNSAGTAYVVGGLDTSSPLDQTAGTFQSATAVTVTTPATTTANEIVFGCVTVFLGTGTTTFTPGTGYTSAQTNNTPTTGQTITVASEYKIVSATGTQIVNGTLPSALQSDIAAATFKLATPATPATAHNLLLLGVGA